MKRKLSHFFYIPRYSIVYLSSFDLWMLWKEKKNWYRQVSHCEVSQERKVPSTHCTSYSNVSSKCLALMSDLHDFNVRDHFMVENWALPDLESLHYIATPVCACECWYLEHENLIELYVLNNLYPVAILHIIVYIVPFWAVARDQAANLPYQRL